MVFLYEATLRSALKDHTSMATPRWRRPDGDAPMATALRSYCQFA
jgi:hypothetical protein